METLATMMVLFAVIAIIALAIAGRSRSAVRAFFTTVGLTAAAVSFTNAAIFAVLVSVANLQA